MNLNTRLILLASCLLFSLGTFSHAEEVIRLKPGESIRPFENAKIEDFYTWLQDTETNDPKGNYSLQDGVLRVSGDGMGYVGTKESYADYHLFVEYKWGKKISDSKYVRNSGLLLHGVGKDGSSRGIWLTSIEVQLAQGCEGDIIVIRGTDQEGNKIPATVTSNTVKASDGKTRWSKDGTPTKYKGSQFWWSKHQSGFKELLDTAGKDDVASPLGEWTKVECICQGNRMTVKINGVTVNEIYDVYPAAGRILFENEKYEILFRNFQITGIENKEPKS